MRILRLLSELPRRGLGVALSITLFYLTAFPVFAQPVTPGTGLHNLIYRQSFRAMRASSANEDLHQNGDAISIEPGATVEIGDFEGPGVIDHIWMTTGSEDPFYGRSMVIRIYWDDNENPSVEVPVGDFFGMGHGAWKPVTSVPLSTSSHGRAKNCFWPMPFRKHARITISNESKQYKVRSLYYYIDWGKYESLPENTLYFHAQYRQAFPAEPGDYTILDARGKGHFAGMVYSVQNMETGWFGEGDDRFYIDGEEVPSLRGTGTEDYFGDAWGFREFNTPFYGVALWEGYFPGDRTTAYRWHINDPIPFEKSLKVTIEHRGSVYTDAAMPLGSFLERSDWISSVAFWYQDAPAGFEGGLPPAENRVAPYTILDTQDLTVRATPDKNLNKTNPGIEYYPMTPDASVEFDFNIEKQGRYQVSAFLTHSLFSGVYQPFLDGKPLGPEIDLCATGSDPVWESFDLHELDAGTHTLRFECRGASPKMRTMAPKAYHLSVIYLVLLRLEDMEGYHAALQEFMKKKK